MILGKIVGKITTINFEFLVTHPNAKKFQFIQVHHPDYGFVLCQILELTRDQNETIGRCTIIGYKDSENRLQGIRTPFSPGTEILNAEDDFIKTIISLSSESAYIGTLEGRDIPIHIDLQSLLTKHVAILAKSGSGKSYTVGVLLEEIMEKNVPLLIIDPHGEYSSIKQPSKDNIEKLAKWKITAKGYSDKVRVYGDIKQHEDIIPLKLNEDMSSYELMRWLPLTLSNAQESILFSIIKDLDSVSFDSIIIGLEQINSNYKWALLDMIWHLKGLELFSNSPTPLKELIRPGKCSILNLKGLSPEIQSMVVGKLLNDCFMARKRGQIPPFFCVIEEAHNFIPEKGFGTAKSSKVIRLISSEGRKFGVGLCVVSQRPALIQKTVLAQCSMQIIMKITNPNDLRMIGNSVEGINSETLNEIQHLAIGSALICGAVDRPLVVNIRKRRSLHGGNAIDVLNVTSESLEQQQIENNQTIKKDEPEKQDNQFIRKEETTTKPKNIFALIKPKICIKDRMMMEGRKVRKITTYLIPGVHMICQMNGEEFPILIDAIKGNIVIDPESDTTAQLSAISPDVAFFTKPIYENIQYDVKLESKQDIQQLIRTIKEKVEIKNHTECYIVYYKFTFDD